MKVFLSDLVLSRLERLQRIVSKIQMESELCDGELNHLESLLQTVSPALISVRNTVFCRQHSRTSEKL